MRRNETPRWPVLLVFAVTLLVYLLIPTRLYYGDGIGFAADIESARLDPTLLFQPNHLIYNFVGYALWSAVQMVHPHARALYVLQGTDSLFGAASAALVCYILLELFESSYIAVWLSFGFAFSATWWKFSTDADSYVASTCFLIASLLLLLPSRKSMPVALALTHCAAMLFHQLALLFLPACLVGLWYQTREYPRTKRLATLGQYLVLAGFITITAYGLAFHYSQGELETNRMARWIASHSYDSAFSWDIGRNLATSAAGNLKLFVGGRVPFIRETWGPFIAISAAAAIGLFVLLIWRFRKRGLPTFGWPNERYAPIVVLCLVWTAVYFVFLVFWLPQNTFYRLFYLPALILLVGTFVASWKSQTRSALALIVGILFCVNLGFTIYPAAQPSLNRTELFARSMQDVWKPGTTVYWDVFASENQTIKYFNPQVRWKKLWNRADVSELAPAFHQAYASGGTLWFDLAALRKLEAEDPAFDDWLRIHCRLGETHQFKNADSIVGFVQLVPLN